MSAAAYQITAWVEDMQLYLERQRDIAAEQREARSINSINWKDPEAVRAYKRERQRMYRRKDI